MFLSGKDLFRYRMVKIGTFLSMIAIVLSMVLVMTICVIYC